MATRALLGCKLLLLTVIGEGFSPPSLQQNGALSFKPREAMIFRGKLSSTQLHFFWGKSEDKEKEKEPGGGRSEEENAGEKAPLFSFLRPDKEKPGDMTSMASEQSATSVATKEEVSPLPAVVAEKPPAPAVPQDPASKIAALRAQAERVRLEAEKMDAELTLSKITRLEREVATKKRKGESTDGLYRDMENLQRKLRGEDTIVVQTPVKDKSAHDSTTDVSSRTTSSNPAPSSVSSPLSTVTAPSQPLAPFSQVEFERTLKEYELFPSYLRVLLARSVGMQPMSARDINATEYAIRSEKQARLDFSFVGDIAPPEFSEEEIAKFKESFSLADWRSSIPPTVDIAELTSDELILQAMKEEYYFKEITNKYGVSKGMAQGFIAGNENDAKKFSAIIDLEMDRSQPYSTIEGLFPKCVEKEGKVPTEAQVKMLISDILPKVGFNAKSQPVEVFGGYLIRGESKSKKGDDLIDAIDAALAKSPMLRDKFTISYIKDLTAVMGVSDDDFEQVMLTNLPRSLYVMGPDVSRERNRVLLTIISSLGIGTSWYLSIYPFLLNPTIMKRAEEQMQLADASMAYDLNWLTDLSLPLFLTFMSLQLTHEIGHRAIGAAYGLNVTLPTFVPSLASGITSSITNLKTPAKNREQLFDFAIAGPLTGMIASMIALYAGLQLTITSDPAAYANFPALPLEILRQSSLGGALIEGVLGNGFLSIPEGARGTQAVASINIALHPVAIAGYISLVVNALSLLPIGVTDGGRISQAVFNRAGKSIVGQLFLLALFAAGILGDDLFLFYAFFCSFFAQGSEIPQRNEVDDISFSRVLFATGVGVVALLSIIPMQ